MTRPIVHLELHTGDLAGARDFYAELCRWRSEQIGRPGLREINIAERR